MALFSTTYFGNIYYYAKLIASDSVTIEAHENYTKQSYRNRTTIAAANGVMNLVVPIVKESGVKSVIKEVRIDYSTRWMAIHERSIVSAYKNSPYFEHYFDLFGSIFLKKYDTLFELNMDITERVLKALNHKIDIVLSDRFVDIDRLSDDYRLKISPKVSLDSSLFGEYYQVFSEKMEFVPNLSILDLLFCEGSCALQYLKTVK